MQLDTSGTAHQLHHTFVCWLQVARVEGRCLVDHAPSPQTCAALEGVWDDTAAGTDAGAGGRWADGGGVSQLTAAASHVASTVFAVISKGMRSVEATHPHRAMLHMPRDCVKARLCKVDGPFVSQPHLTMLVHATCLSCSLGTVCWCCRCITASRAAKMLEQLGVEAEMVTLEVSHDTSECAATWGILSRSPCLSQLNSMRRHCRAAGFGLPEGPLPLRCLRMTAKERQQELARFFPAQCVAAMDRGDQQDL